LTIPQLLHSQTRFSTNHAHLLPIPLTDTLQPGQDFKEYRSQ
jgi:hypothetical protein